MRECGFSLISIFPYKDRIYNSVLIRENTGQWKPVFLHILCNGFLMKTETVMATLVTSPQHSYGWRNTRYQIPDRYRFRQDSILFPFRFLENEPSWATNRIPTQFLPCYVKYFIIGIIQGQSNLILCVLF